MIVGRYAKYKPIAGHEMYVHIDPATNKILVVNGTISVAAVSTDVYPGLGQNKATLLLQLDLKKMSNLYFHVLRGSGYSVDAKQMQIANQTAQLYNYYQGIEANYQTYVDEPVLCIYKMLYFLYLLSNNMLKKSSILPAGKTKSLLVADIAADSLHSISNSAITIISESLGLIDGMNKEWVLVTNYKTASLYGMGLIYAVADLTGLTTKQIEDAIGGIATVLTDAGSTALLSGATYVSFNLPQLCTVDIYLNQEQIPCFKIRPSPSLKAGLRASVKRWFKNYWKIPDEEDANNGKES